VAKAIPLDQYLSNQLFVTELLVWKKDLWQSIEQLTEEMEYCSYIHYVLEELQYFDVELMKISDEK
jgi:hypothetical protein